MSFPIIEVPAPAGKGCGESKSITDEIRLWASGRPNIVRIIYWYHIGDYEGNGYMLVIRDCGQHDELYSLGHCSCSGPLDNNDRPGDDCNLLCQVSCFRNFYADMMSAEAQEEWKTIEEANWKEILRLSEARSESLAPLFYTGATGVTGLPYTPWAGASGCTLSAPSPVSPPAPPPDKKAPLADFLDRLARSWLDR